MKRKKKMVRISIAGILLCSVLFAFLVAADRGRIRTSTEAVITEEVVSYVIDSVQITEDVQIQGWAMILGEEIESVNCNVMLVGEQSKKQWILPTMTIERNDLTEAFLDGVDYAKAGFLANIKKSRLSLEKEDYRIYLEYLTNGHSYLVPTNQMVRAVRETVWQETDNEKAALSFFIDSITAKKKVLTISGWLFCQENLESQELVKKLDLVENLEKQQKTEVLLFNLRTQKAYVIPTDSVERADLKEHFSANEKDDSFQYAGFIASVETWRFDFGYDLFEVCLRYTDENGVFLIHTGQYVDLEEQEEL